MREETMQSSGGATQQRMQAMREQVQHDYVEPAMESVKGVMHDRPMTSVATVFGAGFAIGLLIGTSLLADSSRRRRQSTVERLGEQVLDAVSRVLPESLAQQIHR